jgi:NTE family protein
MKKIILIAAMLTCRTVLAQPCSYKNLAFEGAGIRGIAYAGVVDELDKRGILPCIQRVAGTSAGALIALTVSLGYSATEIEQITAETDFSEFNDGQYIFFGGLHRMTKHYGWYRGGKFDSWLENLIRAKTSDGNITFAELHRRHFRSLYITATCLNRQKLLIFSKDTYPNMKVKDAVRISMSIPLYFEAVFIDANGSVIEHPENRKNLDLVVDGGITGNFPIFVFDSLASVSTTTKARVSNRETLGIRIDSDAQIESDQVGRELTTRDIKDIRSYVEAFYTLVLETLNRNQLTDADWVRTISVSSLDVGPRIKKLDSNQKNRLMESGRQGVRKFFEQ